MNSCLYEGVVTHVRSEPIKHRFTYSLIQLFVDLDEVDEIFKGRWLWSSKRMAIAWFRRADYIGDPKRPIADCVRDLVFERTGTRAEGPIRMLTHPRYFGFVMNPVSFYYCYDKAGETVTHIVSEITNTPWNERFSYVHRAKPGEDALSFQFEKDFHVSPFMPMEMDYDWQFSEPTDALDVRMINLKQDQEAFRATLKLEKLPLTAKNLRRALIAYPLMTVKVAIGIYWQAFLLWMKRTPFYSHPKHNRTQEAS